VKCCCGKVCNGIRGLKTHQRCCRVIVGGNLYEELVEEIAPNEDIVEQEPTDSFGVEIKPGIRLPEISPIMIGKLQTNILGTTLEVSKLILKTSSPSLKI